MAVAQLFAQRHRGFGILLLRQQHQVGKRREYGFHRRLPGRIGDRHHVGEQVVRDAGLAQRLAEGADIVRIGAASGGEVLQHLVEVALFLFQLGDAQAQAVAFPRQPFELASVGELVALCVLHLLFQPHFLFDDGFPAPQFAVQFIQCALLVLFVFLCGLAAQLRRCECLPLRLQFELRACAFGALGAPFAALREQRAARVVAFALQQVVREAGAYFGCKRNAFLVQAVPFQVAVHFLLVLFQIVAQRFELVLSGIQFARGMLLVAARLFVTLQHFLIAKHLEHQVEQVLVRQFAQLVGLPLFQRKHAGDCRRQPRAVQDALVVAHAELFAFLLHLPQAHFAVGDPVFARPIAAFLVDAAGQRDPVLLVGQAERAVVRAGRALVVHHAAQPAEILAVAAHVALVVALLRAFQRQQRAHGVEQGGLAGTVGAGDGDDGRIQRQFEIAPVVPVDGFQFDQSEHQDSSSLCSSPSVTSRRMPRCFSTSDSAPCRMRGAISA